jgi:cell division protein FtsW
VWRISLDLKSVIDTRRKGDPDIILFLSIFLLIGIGIAMSYSASAVYAYNVFGDSFYFLKKQLIWFGIGFVFLLIFMEIDYRIYLKHTKILLLLAFVLLIAVLIPGVGHNVKGAARWLGYGSLKLQPSEFVKIVVVIYLVKVFSSDKKGNYVVQLLIPLVIVSVILLLLQPDFGTAVDLLIVSVFILFVSGFPLLYIVTLFLLSIPMFYLLVYQVEYRRERVLAYLNPWKDRYGIGYHIIQSFIAFKKGGILGLGLGNGTQKLSRLPEPHTDFIFAVIAEEVGLIGTIFMVIIFFLFFFRGLTVSINSIDGFGKLLAIGLSLMILVQAYINIGVVSGSLPTTGIPLPFISYGGSSLISSMISAGILLNISRYKDAIAPDVNYTEEVWQ